MPAEVTSLFIVSEGVERQQIADALDAQTVFFTGDEAQQFINDNQQDYNTPLKVVRFTHAR